MKNLINGLIFALLLSIIGCGTESQKSTDLQTFEYHAAYAVLHEGGINPNIVPDDSTKIHPRAQCPTGGWVTHGDGHKTRCPFCDPPYVSTEEPPVVEEVKPIPQPPVKPVVQPQPVKPVYKAPVVQPPVKYYYYRNGRWS